MKKLTIQEFNQNYMMIAEKTMIFEEEYPDKKQFDYITNKVYHPEIKEYEVKYSAILQLIHMGEVGKYRMDGVPFGINAIIITIEVDDEEL